MPNSLPRTLTLLLSADDAYARPLAMTMYSALVHLNKGWSVDLYIIDGGISAENRTRIARVARETRVDVTLRWISIDSKRVENLPIVNEWVSLSAYLRLYLSELLPETCNRVIYVDSDMLITSSLSALWQKPLEETALCAVQDYFIPYVSSPLGLNYYEELGLDPKTPYFNTGLMVINLSHWREQQIGEKALCHIRTYEDRLNFHDQEGLNAVVAGNWTPLDPAWNLFVTPPLLRHVPPSAVRSELVAHPHLFRDAHVFHFAGSKKPWRLGSTYHSMRRRWYQYLWQSAWHTPMERWRSIGTFSAQHAWGWGVYRTRAPRHRIRSAIERSAHTLASAFRNAARNISAPSVCNAGTRTRGESHTEIHSMDTQESDVLPEDASQNTSSQKSDHHKKDVAR